MHAASARTLPSPPPSQSGGFATRTPKLREIRREPRKNQGATPGACETFTIAECAFNNLESALIIGQCTFRIVESVLSEVESVFTEVESALSEVESAFADVESGLSDVESALTEVESGLSDVESVFNDRQSVDDCNVYVRPRRAGAFSRECTTGSTSETSSRRSVSRCSRRIPLRGNGPCRRAWRGR